MASWLGKDTEFIQGAADQAFKPSATPVVGEDKRQDCLNTCNDRYQKDLDNPSVDYMEAQRRYMDCKRSCEDVGMIEGTTPAPGQVGIAARPEPPGEPPPPTPPPPTPPPGEFCKGGHRLHQGPHIPGAPGQLKCSEGFEAKYNKQDGWAWCCPTAEPGEPSDPGAPREGCIKRASGKAECPEGYKQAWFMEEEWKYWCCPKKEEEEGCEGGYISEDGTCPPDMRRMFTKGGTEVWCCPTEAGCEGGYRAIGETCPEGYFKKMIGGVLWCCPEEKEEEEENGNGKPPPPPPPPTTPTTPGEPGEPPLGEYEQPDWLKELRDMLVGRGMQEPYAYPGWLTSLRDKLMGRGEELLDPSQYGYSQEAMDAMFGRGFEKVRGAGAATRETLQDVLSRSGMLGTGTETSKMAETAWETEGGISDLQRDLFVKGEEQRKKDLLQYTGLAQDIFGRTGLTSETLLEAINAARTGMSKDIYTDVGLGGEGFREMINVGRRGERQSWYQMLLDFFRTLMY